MIDVTEDTKEMPSTGPALVTTSTLEQIEAARAGCFELYEQAFTLLRQAQDMAGRAAPAIRGLPDMLRGRDHFGYRGAEDLLNDVRVAVDQAIWGHLLRVTKMDTLMDRTAKDQFAKQIEKDPPPATADNCRATIDQLMQDSGTIFRRGIATVFSQLDRRFRSHDGFKIGDRLVITNYAGADGYVSGSGRVDTLLDIERTFAILDGKAPPERGGGIVGALGLAKPGGCFGAAAYKAESDYFRAQVFKNGNAHLWFKRDDLVEKVNLLLAEYYGANLGVSPDAAEVKPEYNRTPAKNFGFFETPIPLADKILERAKVWGSDTYRGDYPKLTVLEPNAGGGRIALRAAGRGHKVTCVEIQHHLVAGLKTMGAALDRVICDDFLDIHPDELGKFERIVMNPPFDNLRDVDHVDHALKFLAPGGILVSVMAVGVEFRQDRKAVAFREKIAALGGRFEDLPMGSFSESGTNVNTVLCIVGAGRY